MLLAIAVIPPLLIAVVLHEVAHGWVAEKLGDPTARSLGRITLNPIPHIDPFMTVLFPAFLILAGSPFVFGGAKPVPVNPVHFRNPRRHMAYVALAGPVVNFILALFCYLAFLALRPLLSSAALPELVGLFMKIWLLQGILINLILGIFNLLPIPPLDGGRIAVGFLPRGLALPLARVEPFGIMIVLLLLFSGLLGELLGPILGFVMQPLARLTV